MKLAITCEALLFLTMLVLKQEIIVYTSQTESDLPKNIFVFFIYFQDCFCEKFCNVCSSDVMFNCQVSFDYQRGIFNKKVANGSL